MAARPRVRVSGPLALFVGGFSGELARLGYTPLSARLQLQLMAHLSRWLASERLDAAALTPAVLERFLAARRAAGYANHRTPKAVAPLLAYLRGLGAAPPLPDRGRGDAGGGAAGAVSPLPAGRARPC